MRFSISVVVNTVNYEKDHTRKKKTKQPRTSISKNDDFVVTNEKFLISRFWPILLEIRWNFFVK